jgi:hypothetical protein
MFLLKMKTNGTETKTSRSVYLPRAQVMAARDINE